MYQLNFTPDSEGDRNYEICFQAFAMCDKQFGVDEWDDVVALGRKFKRIGRPADQKVGKTQLFELAGSGGELGLERSEMKMLKGMIDRPIWRTMALEDVVATKAWLHSLKYDGGQDKVAGSIEPKAANDG